MSTADGGRDEERSREIEAKIKAAWRGIPEKTNLGLQTVCVNKAHDSQSCQSTTI